MAAEHSRSSLSHSQDAPLTAADPRQQPPAERHPVALYFDRAAKRAAEPRTLPGMLEVLWLHNRDQEDRYNEQCDVAFKAGLPSEAYPSAPITPWQEAIGEMLHDPVFADVSVEDLGDYLMNRRVGVPPPPESKPVMRALDRAEQAGWADRIFHYVQQILGHAKPTVVELANVDPQESLNRDDSTIDTGTASEEGSVGMSADDYNRESRPAGQPIHIDEVRRLELAMGEDGEKVMAIIHHESWTVDQRLRALLKFDRRFAGYTSEKLGEMLGTTAAAVRKTAAWKDRHQT